MHLQRVRCYAAKPALPLLKRRRRKVSKQSEQSPPLLWQPDDPEVLHSFLMTALDLKVLKPWEAAQILDECQETDEARVVMPEVLRPALLRLQLWQADASPTLH